MDSIIRQNFINENDLHLLDEYHYISLKNIKELKNGVHVRYIDKYSKKIKKGGILIMNSTKLKLKSIDNNVFWEVDPKLNYIYYKKMIRNSSINRNFSNLLKSIENGTLLIK